MGRYLYYINWCKIVSNIIDATPNFLNETYPTQQPPTIILTKCQPLQHVSTSTIYIHHHLQCIKNLPPQKIMSSKFPVVVVLVFDLSFLPFPKVTVLGPWSKVTSPSGLAFFSDFSFSASVEVIPQEETRISETLVAFPPVNDTCMRYRR